VEKVILGSREVEELDFFSYLAEDTLQCIGI